MLLSKIQIPAALIRSIYCTLLLLLLIASSPLLSAPGAHGPNGEHLDTAVAVNASGLMRLPDGSVNVPVAAQRRMELRTQLLDVSATNVTTELPGWVITDPNYSGRVQAINNGRLEPGPKGFPVVGQPVSANEILAYVRYQATPYEAASQQAQLTELINQRELAASRLARLKTLAGSVATKEIDAAQAELNSLIAREQKISTGLTAREALVAPVSGVIAYANAIAGQVINPAESLFEIVDQQHLLIEAVTAQPALIQQISHAYVADTPQVRLAFNGAAGILRDGVLPLMFSTELNQPGAVLPLVVGQPLRIIAVLKEQTEGIVLPAEAVVRNSVNEAVVWIKSGAERYIPQPVRFRRLNAGQVVVLQGLNPDNRVVIQGASLLAQIR